MGAHLGHILAGCGAPRQVGKVSTEACIVTFLQDDRDVEHGRDS